MRMKIFLWVILLQLGALWIAGCNGGKGEKDADEDTGETPEDADAGEGDEPSGDVQPDTPAEEPADVPSDPPVDLEDAVEALVVRVDPPMDPDLIEEGPPPCDGDDYEENDSIETASDLGIFNDSDDTVYYISGSDIWPSGDEDWYSAYVNNMLLGDMEVDVNLGSLIADLDLCVTFECESGTVSVACNSPTDVPVGSDTCCSRQTGTASERVILEPQGCTGSGNGTAYFLVYGSGGATQCNYYLTYKF